jgi:NADH dehydrogenase/NADH:ubiquinone oxidoreductase subunit G
MQRNNYPRVKIFSKLIVVSWYNAINIFFLFLFTKDFNYFEAKTGSFLDLESLYSLKILFNSLGCSNINYQFNYNLFFDFRFTFLMNITILNLEFISFCFFVGLNLRVESPLLNSRLRKNYLQNDNFFLCFSIGLSLDYLSFPVINLGNSLKAFKYIIEARHSFLNYFCLNDFVSLKLLNFNFNLFNNFSFFLGSSSLYRIDANFFFDSLGFFMSKYSKNLYFVNNGLNVISNFLGRLSSFEVGCLPGTKSSNFCLNLRKKISFLYLLGTENFFFDNLEQNNFVVYQGGFQEFGSFFKNISLIFPVSIYTERVSTFLNLEGRIRRTQKAIVSFRFVYTD